MATRLRRTGTSSSTFTSPAPAWPSTSVARVPPRRASSCASFWYSAAPASSGRRLRSSSMSWKLLARAGARRGHERLDGSERPRRRTARRRADRRLVAERRPRSSPSPRRVRVSRRRATRRPSRRPRTRASARRRRPARAPSRTVGAFAVDQIRCDQDQRTPPCGTVRRGGRSCAAIRPAMPQACGRTATPASSPAPSAGERHDGRRHGGADRRPWTGARRDAPARPSTSANRPLRPRHARRPFAPGSPGPRRASARAVVALQAPPTARARDGPIADRPRAPKPPRRRRRGRRRHSSVIAKPVPDRRREIGAA